MSSFLLNIALLSSSYSKDFFFLLLNLFPFAQLSFLASELVSASKNLSLNFNSQ